MDEVKKKIPEKKLRLEDLVSDPSKTAARRALESNQNLHPVKKDFLDVKTKRTWEQYKV